MLAPAVSPLVTPMDSLNPMATWMTLSKQNNKARSHKSREKNQVMYELAKEQNSLIEFWHSINISDKK